MAEAIEAMEQAFREQGEGKVTQPPRLNLKAGKGWLRLGPAVMEGSGWMGFKAMNLAAGLGFRYQVHLYRIADGELLAIMDAQHLTTLRTGATSAVATRRLAPKEPTTVGVLGSSVEARAQLEAIHALGLTRAVRVYSRTPENRERFARTYGHMWKLDVKPVGSAREAVEGCGEWLSPGMHVNSVGTARPDQREIDPVTFQRSAITVVDTREGVFGEAGDALAAKGVVSAEDVFELADLVAGRAPVRSDAKQITLFKSVGTAVQDIGLAVRVYQKATEMGLGKKIPGFPIVKKT
jgi:ornithine cyclodeaminase/alanine dehydrogenase-like protein (mu-crystallin family)